MYFLWQDNNNCSKSKNITPIHIILQNISSTTHIISKFCGKFKESAFKRIKQSNLLGSFFACLYIEATDLIVSQHMHAILIEPLLNQIKTFKFWVALKMSAFFWLLCKGREVEKNQIFQFKLWFRITHIGYNRVRMLYQEYIFI